MAMGAASPKLRKLAAGNAFVGQQHRNAIVNAIDALRIDSDQGFLQIVHLHGPVDPPNIPLANLLIESIQTLAINRSQRDAGGWAAEDLKQSAINGHGLSDFSATPAKITSLTGGRHVDRLA